MVFEAARDENYFRPPRRRLICNLYLPSTNSIKLYDLNRTQSNAIEHLLEFCFR